MGSIIYLFISANKSHHKQEFLNAICFPEKSHIVVAYSNKWIPEPLRDVQKLIGREALLSFCEFRQDETPRTRLHPSRWVQIVGCVQESSGFCLTLMLGPFQNYDKTDDDILQMLESFQNKILKHERNPAAAPVSANPFFVLESSVWDQGEKSNNWVAVAQHLRGLFRLKECSFFRIESAKDDSKLFPIKSVKLDQSWTFEVPASSSQQITLKVISGKDIQFCSPKIELSSSVGQALGPVLQQFSEGLECRYKIDFAPQLQKQSSIIRIYSDVPDFSSPSFQAFVTARPNRVALGAILVLISLAPIFSTMADLGISFCGYEMHVSMKLVAWIFILAAFALAFRRFKIA